MSLQNYKTQYNPSARVDKYPKKTQSLTRLKNSRNRESVSRKHELSKQHKISSEKQKTE